MKEGLKRGAKRKAKEFLTKEVTKRAKKYKDTFCVKKKRKMPMRPIRSRPRRARAERGLTQRGGLLVNPTRRKRRGKLTRRMDRFVARTSLRI